MALTLYNTALTVPAGTEFPGDVQGLLDLIAQYLAISGGSSFSGINFGPTEPSEDNRDKPWFKTDNSGNPIGWYSWNGLAWAAIPLTMPSGGAGDYPSPPSVGMCYLDTDIDVAMIYNNGAWTTLSGSPGDLKFTTAASEAAALTQNPGWSVYSTGAGRTLVVSGSGSGLTVRAPGDTFGLETVTLTEDQMPEHSHPFSLTGVDGSDSPNGPPVTGDISKPKPPARDFVTENTGGGESHENCQPSRVCVCLVKN